VFDLEERVKALRDGPHAGYERGQRLAVRRRGCMHMPLFSAPLLRNEAKLPDLSDAFSYRRLP
jgi:hypothetical protein